MGEGLVEAFPAGPGRVLVAQAEGARSVVVDGLRAKGWTSTRSSPTARCRPRSRPPCVAAASGADAITFTSASAVTSYLAAAGPEAVPATVVCIGPVTAAAARAGGLAVAAVATEHTLDGLVEAAVEALRCVEL